MSSFRTELLLAVSLTQETNMSDSRRAIIEVAAKLKKIGDEIEAERVAHFADGEIMQDFVRATIIAVGAVAVSGIIWRWVNT